jgi:large subunit ribosomal protein L18
MSAQSVRKARVKRHTRIRGKISGTSERPRVSVFRSNRGIYIQLIDDTRGITVVAARSQEVDASGLDKTAIARKVGELLGQRARGAGIEHVVFDRSGYLYHGRVKALAEGAREAGLVF